MQRFTLARTAVAAALLASAGAANADVLVFTGSMTGIGISGPDATCAPSPFRGNINPASTTGTSSLGNFTYTHNICFGGFSGPVQGTFAIDFGTDSFFGTMTGSTSPNATPGIANLMFDYTILNGTGRFLDATGTFAGMGTTDARVPPPVVSLAFDGVVNAVPEPGTWAMMLLGFGAAGTALRRSRRRADPAFA